MLVSLLRLFLVQAHLGCVKRLQNGFVTLRAKLCSTVYCNRSCLWVCLCVEGVRVCVLVSVPTITRNCLHRSSPNWVRRWSDHLQLIKFWPSCIPEKGVCGWAKIFGFTLLQPVHSVCVASVRFFHLIMIYRMWLLLISLVCKLFQFAHLWNGCSAS